MKTYIHLRDFKVKKPVVALGTFDGVHLGHRQILASTIQYAKRVKGSAVAITFDPHPQQVIVPERGLRLLTTLPERLHIFSQLGLHASVVIHFNPILQELSYEEFVKRYLVDKLHADQVFVGYDYAFGHDRAGHVAELNELGKTWGFKVHIIPPVVVDGLTVKSSLIRDLLSLGKFDRATHFLGGPYWITGKVGYGSDRGKKMGFPTANLTLHPDKLIPAHGVYCGWVRVGGRQYQGVVNVGARPTFAEGIVAFEVHILNFHRNIRGKTIQVALLHRLRDEMQFSDVEELKDQIREDIERSRFFLKHHPLKKILC